VLDNQAPSLNGCPGNVTKYTAPGVPALVTWTDPTAIDNCQQSVQVTCTPTNGSTFASGTTLVTCLANDASGNANTCAFSVIIIESEAPRITQVEVLGANVLVHFTTQNGTHYALEDAGSIASNTWSNVVSGITGTGNVITVTNSGGAILASRFYRVRVIGL
jgi:hypothetical protein